MSVADEPETIADLVDPELEASLGESFCEIIESAEERLIRGKSVFATKAFLKRNFAIEASSAQRLVDIIFGMWKIEAASIATRNERADDLRRKYHHVFQVAIDKGDLRHALHALDSLGKLDALVMPDVNINIANVPVTNKTRERVTQLIEKMKTMAEKRANYVNEMHTNKQLMDAKFVEHKNGNGKSNGHHKTLEEINASVIEKSDKKDPE